MGIFYPNCTTPPDEAGLVASPNVRSTSDIVWSCAAVIGLCTWVVLHPNVPIEASYTRLAQWISLQSYLLALKVLYFVVALVAPEAVAGRAMMSLYAACCNVQLMEELAKKDQVPWTLSHAFLANMGGFAIEFDRLAIPPTKGPVHDAARQSAEFNPSGMATEKVAAQAPCAMPSDENDPPGGERIEVSTRSSGSSPSPADDLTESPLLVPASHQLGHQDGNANAVTLWTT